MDDSISEPVDKLDVNELKRYKHQLQLLFDTGLITKNFNGGILVAKGGNILYEKYLGFTNPNIKKDSINKNTSFHLASTSKPFTGVTVLKLAEKGLLRLDDDLTRFFPSFPYPGVTVKQLLSHRSGLPNYLYFMDGKSNWPKGKLVSNKDVLQYLIDYQPAVNFKPNKRFSYNNTNYVLLALIVEKVTGKSFPQYLKDSIFTPLQMQHSFVYTPADSTRVIMSYKPSGAIWENDIFENTYGDKNIYSTPEDMLRWDSALYDPKFINQSLLDSAFQPFSHEKPSIHNYGLGWRLLNFPNGKNVVYHFGKWHGFTPAFARLIDEKAVIIILGNRYNQNIYNEAKKSYLIFGDYKLDSANSGLDDENQGKNTNVSMPPPTSKKKAQRAESQLLKKGAATTKPKQDNRNLKTTRENSKINSKKLEVKPEPHKSKTEVKSKPENKNLKPKTEVKKTDSKNNSSKNQQKSKSNIKKKPVTSSSTKNQEKTKVPVNRHRETKKKN
jgi:CubicO group peptidase (beta-lactamase class C family)